MDTGKEIRDIFSEFPGGSKQQINTLERKKLKQEIKKLKNENRNRRKRGSKQKNNEEIKQIHKEIAKIEIEIKNQDRVNENDR